MSIYKINLSSKDGEISIKVLIIYYKFESNYILYSKIKRGVTMLNFTKYYNAKKNY